MIYSKDIRINHQGVKVAHKESNINFYFIRLRTRMKLSNEAN